MLGGSTIEELPDGGNNSVFVGLHAHTSHLILLGRPNPKSFQWFVQHTHLNTGLSKLLGDEEPQQAAVA
jgi:hypothetical protein